MNRRDPLYLEYPSSRDADLRLFAEFTVPEKPRRILLHMHGWHGAVKRIHPDNVEAPSDPHWFLIRPEMRGRGDATGEPDANGWELQDAVDAVEFAKREFAGQILDPELITLSGGSGGGGNVFALLGKFPDYFCCSQADCGISDYALWFRGDEAGEFRDEMEGQGWIGGNPDTCPEAYASRSGITTVANLLTPLIVFHGETDIRVPSEQSRRYVAEAQRLGKGSLVTYHELKGVGMRSHWGNITSEQVEFHRKTGNTFLHTGAPPVEIPRQGRFVVAGYVKTKHFEVVLDSIDHVGEVEYDLDAAACKITAPTARHALLQRRNADGTCEEERLLIKSPVTVQGFRVQGSRLAAENSEVNGHSKAMTSR